MSDPIGEAVEAALAGALIVLPTDTVYGIGTRPDDPHATARLFEAKGRPRDLELPVLVATRGQAREIATFDERAEALAGRFWPGALSFVLPRAERSRGWDLGEDRGTIAVRMPHHPLALAVLAGTGPLAVTSANRSGAAITPNTCEELRAVFGDLVEVYLCGEEPLGDVPSTVVDLTGPEPLVLRAGAVSPGRLNEALDPTDATRGRQGPR
ncbi:MAG TPA: L-threonylcarbamoyladenylate synthase [Actinomycetota bacterium]|nr:L-threonylcarbamoyladenylate synthase [Actinomycetota bacterium]